MSALQLTQNLHDVLAHAVYEGFPKIEYEVMDREAAKLGDYDKLIKRSRQINLHDLTVELIFLQSWPSTSLGFGGVGGQAFTDAYTFIVSYSNIYNVYFGSRFAYQVTNPNQNFFEDMTSQNMKTVQSCKIYK